MAKELYGLYSIISNKTVRKHEKYFRKFPKFNKEAKGRLIKTNRGYFIDGHQVDLKSVNIWNNLNIKKSE